MNKQIRRAITLILSAATVVGIASCGKEQTPSDDSKTPVGTTADVTSLKSGPVFPDLEFDNEEILFLTEDSDNSLYMSREIYAESQNGELINDAVYKRNLKVEEQFKVKIAEERVIDATNQAHRTLLAGDDVYDVVMPY